MRIRLVMLSSWLLLRCCRSFLKVYLLCSSDHCNNSIFFCHLFSILACLLLRFKSYFMLFDHFALLYIKFFLALSGSDCHLAIVSRVFFVFLFKLSMDFLLHLLLDHATEPVSHRVAGCFENGQTSCLTSIIFLIFAFNLGLK